jgi:hypothetical protein
VARGFDSGGARLGFECGGGVVGEVEVDAAGVLAFDEVRGGAKVDVELVPGEKGVGVAIAPGLGGEAEEALEVHGAGEILDGENGNDAGDGLCWHSDNTSVARINRRRQRS